MNAAVVDLAAIVEQAAADASKRQRRKMSEDATQAAWVAALEAERAGLDPAGIADACRKAFDRARRTGTAGLLSIDVVAPSGVAHAELLAAAPTPSPEPVSIRNPLSLLPDGPRQIAAQVHLQGADPTAAIAFERTARAQLRRSARLHAGKPAPVQVGIELSVILQTLGVDRLPPELRAQLGAAVQLAERHHREFARLVEMGTRAGRTGAVGLTHPDRLIDLAAKGWGMTPAMLSAAGTGKRASRAVTRAKMGAVGLLWRYSSIPSTDIARMVQLDPQTVRYYVDDSARSVQHHNRNDPAFAKAWQWCCQQVGVDPVRDWIVRPGRHSCRACGVALVPGGGRARTPDLCASCRAVHAPLVPVLCRCGCGLPVSQRSPTQTRRGHRLRPLAEAS